MRRFLAVWGASFVKPESKEVLLQFFSELNGYDAEDRKHIYTLEVGKQWRSAEFYDHTVTRLPDSPNQGPDGQPPKGEL